MEVYIHYQFTKNSDLMKIQMYSHLINLLKHATWVIVPPLAFIPQALLPAVPLLYFPFQNMRAQ